MTQQDLADALLVTKGNISQLLGKMEHDGLIARCQEGRTNCLFLTERGRVLFAELVPQQKALLAELLIPLSSEEQPQLTLLRKLDHIIAD